MEDDDIDGALVRLAFKYIDLFKYSRIIFLMIHVIAVGSYLIEC